MLNAQLIFEYADVLIGWLFWFIIVMFHSDMAGFDVCCRILVALFFRCSDLIFIGFVHWLVVIS